GQAVSARGGGGARRRRRAVEARRQPVGDVARVAAERLVAAVAVEGDGDVTARDLGEVEGGDRGRVREGLAVMAHDLWEDRDRIGAHDELLVLGAELLGD